MCIRDRSYLQFLFDMLDLPFLPTFTDAQFKLKTRFNEQNELTVLGPVSYTHLDVYKRQVTISPNFSNNNLTLNGNIIPLDQSNIFKGRSW